MPEEKQETKNPQRDLILFEVDINHPCWVCDVTERNKDASITSSPAGIVGDNIINLLDLKSPTPKDDIAFIKKHPLVRSVEILMLRPNGAMLKVTSDYKAMTLKILHESNVSLLESPITQGGLDSEILLAHSYKDLNDLISKWKEQAGYNVKLKSKRYLKQDENLSLDAFRTSGFFDLKSAKELLTQKQLEIFKMACDYGYYNNPKRITIDELAERTGISSSTLAEHLRKAEAKILPIFWKVLRKI